MLTELHLSNFKSWRELDMKLGRVTGLFGTNSSGKSSILQFLLMLKQTKDATDSGLVLDLGGQNQLVNLGSFNDLIFFHNESLLLKWRIAWSSSEIYTVNEETSVSIGYKDKQIKLFSCSYKRINLVNEEVKIYDHDDLELFDALYEMYDLNRMYYLAPLREYPQREYRWSGASPSSVGTRGEYAINAILAATIRKESRKLPNSNKEKSFQEIIAYWLKELGLIYEFSVKEIAKGRGLYDVIVKKNKDGTEAFLTDVGFGVSQVLPALVLLYYVPEGSIILMEQPEIHLHPSVQSGLADVILQVSKQRNLQVIVESHSEHLLRRFQRRIAEEQYPADDIKLYFCDSQQGESKLVDLKINEYGEIENWPENFFGDEMAEIAAMRNAGLKRKIKQAAQNAG